MSDDPSHRAVLDGESLAQLYQSPSAPPLRCWEAVRKLEGSSQLLAIRDNACGSSFPILDYLAYCNIKVDKLDTRRQHCHAVVTSLKEPNSNMFGHMGNAQSVAKSGEYANATADSIEEEIQNGTIEFSHREDRYRLYFLTYQQPFGSEQRLVVLAWQSDKVKGKTLVAEVFKWASQLRDEMWVYNGATGGWRKDKKFYSAVQAAKEEDLILPKEIVSGLQRDTATFFANQSLYNDLGVPWKRGILLLGPPGNGKTGVIKVLAKACAERNVPTLYVQTAKTRAGPEYGMTAIFQKARQVAPCILVLEGIETFVTGELRTFLLNQLDGIEDNTGVLVIATANDISQLDPAILERPSRFDTKYQFELPDIELRKRFIGRWLEHKVGISRLSLTPEENLSSLVDDLVARTEGWTFAFLKELFLSVLLIRASIVEENGRAGAKGITSEHIVAQVTQLQSQVRMVSKEGDTNS